MPEIMKFLDELEESREERLQNRPEIPQHDGFRHEWATYYEEYANNFSMD